MKKIGLVVAIILLVIGFFYFNINQLLTLDGLKVSLVKFEALRDHQPLLVGGLFLLFYVLITALSLPGALILTLAAGALFGLLWGVVIASFASTIGATLAFLASRYLFNDWVQLKFAKRLKAFNDGFARDGAFYLLTLRLVPIFPFFLVNFVMGLTPISVLSYYFVSQVGMFAGTLVYVNAGTELAKLESLSGILSPSLLVSFVLLGVFPLLAQKLLSVIKVRRLYQSYHKPKHFDRNLIVIGAGAGGLVSAYISAMVKAKVTLVEAHKMGGDCLNYGCVPSKALIKSAKVAHQMRHAEKYGLVGCEPSFSFRSVMERIQKIIGDIEPHDSVERYEKLGVDVVQGYAKVIDPWTVEIQRHDGEVQRMTTRSIVLATGSKPFVPNIPGLHDVGFLTSDTLWEAFSKLDEPPRRLIVLGGGPIGCELSQAFARLGSTVTQVERSKHILEREDEDVSVFARTSLMNDGVTLLTRHNALRCEFKDGQKCLVLEHKGKELVVEFDALICAVGREARLEGYGLEALGIETKRTIVTNEYLETLYPNIFAAGDVAGPYQLTHVAAHQAWYATVNALFGAFKKFRADYNVIPWTTFTDPEIARVGLSEKEAQEQGIAYEKVRYSLENLDRAITESETKGFVKILTVPNKDQILGVMIIGEHSSELLAEFVLAMNHGLGLNKILGTIHTYPTWTEANKYVAGEWKRAHVSNRVLAWLEKYHSWRRG